jgi:DNA-binding CsgD family transcriptional regulator
MLGDVAVTPLVAGTALPEPDALLRAALDRARRATGLPIAFGGMVSRGGRTMRLTALTGTRTDALRGLVITAGTGLGGQVLVTARPGSVDDYAADARISHEYDKPVTAEGLRAIVAVPVLVAGAVFGILYGAVREPLTLGNRVLDPMGHIAARTGIELSVRSEVERRLAEQEAARITKAACESPTAPEWEQVREAHAQLRSIARDVTDPALRRRIEAVCDQLTLPQDRPARGNPLSPRELDVLALVAVGCGNAETGRRLGLLPETVKSYLRNAMRKLGTHTRIETIVAARRAGFLP